MVYLVCVYVCASFVSYIVMISSSVFTWRLSVEPLLASPETSILDDRPPDINDDELFLTIIK